MFRSAYIVGPLLLATLLSGCGDDPTAIDTTPPAQILDLAVVAVTDTSVTLNWTAPGDDGTEGQAWQYDLRAGLTPPPFNLESAPQADTLAQPQAAGSSEQTTLGGLLAEEDYYFTIRTVDEAENWSSFSPVVIAHTTADTIPPADVADLAATALSHKAVELTWTAPGDSNLEGTATAYEIRYSQEPITEENWADATAATEVPPPHLAGSPESFAIGDLDDLTTYHFALKTTDDGLNQSALSNIPSVTTPIDDVPPTPVSDLAVIGVTYSTATLTWTATGDDGNKGRAASYDIRYAEEPVTGASWDEASIALVDITPSTAGERDEVIVSRIQPGTTYYFALRAGDERENLSPISNTPNSTLVDLFGRVWRISEDGSGDAPTIQAGVDSATVGDTVLVAPGTYQESIDFQGKDIVVRSAEGPEITVIQGAPDEDVVSMISGEGSSAYLVGFTVTGGQRGVRISNSEPVIWNNHITENVNDNFGGGIDCYSSRVSGRKAPLIVGNLISMNSAGTSGGGIFCVNRCTPVIRDNVIRENRAEFGDGGGIYLQPELSGSVVCANLIQQNLASDKGGGIFLAAIAPGISVEISHNQLVTNEAHGGHLTGFSAGGIAIRHVDAWAHHNTLVANLGFGPGGTYGGSIAMDRGGSPIIEENIVAFTEWGGAIRCLDPATPTIRDNIVWDSVGGHGSGTCTDWTASSGNVEADPVFCDPANDDYRVRSDSPALTHPEGPIGAFPNAGCSAPATWSPSR